MVEYSPNIFKSILPPLGGIEKLQKNAKKAALLLN